MTDDRIARLAELFDRALAVPTPGRRQFIAEACADDAALRQDLTSLLDAHASAPGVLEDLEGAVSLAYTALADHARGGPALRAELQLALSGSYRIEQELGGGSMSRVFVAEETRLARKIVIKVLASDVAASMSGERFRREIQLTGQLQHPYIVPLLTSGSAGRLLYYTMPLVAGESLRARIAREGRLPVRDAVAIWRDVLEALAYAHAHGVLHRDIKPGNILLSGRNALVTDFGIARAVEAAAGDANATHPGIAIGTPAYMAPEQVTADSTMDHRADLYAAGLVMYEMLEDRLPWTQGSAREQLSARLTASPPPLQRADVPDDLAALVARCLQPDPGARPESADGVIAGLDGLSAALPGGRRRRRLAYGVGALALVVAAVTVTTARLRQAPTGVPASPASLPSIAVLPLSAVGTDAADTSLASGMTEVLTGVLGRSGGMRVIASTSVAALHARRLTATQVAESLGVSHLLEGSVQKVGSRLRMQVRLVDARDGVTRWSETYDREIGDIFAVEDDIARSVAGALDARLLATGAPARPRRYTPNVVAYEWYVRGRSAALLRTSEGRQQSTEFLNRAIAADSNFAAAHAALVWPSLNSAGSAANDYDAWRIRAERAALAAVRLDASLPEGHAALGWVRMVQRDWPGAEAELKRAVAMDPTVFRGHEGLARLYMLTRRPADQLLAARQGMDVDPYSHLALREMGLALNMNGRCDETLELLRPLKSLSPPAGVAGVIMGLCYIRKEMWPEAIAELRWAGETTEARSALMFLGYALARAGQRDAARRILVDLRAGRARSHDAFGMAVVSAGLREYDQAFAWLARAQQEKSVRVYIMDPVFAELHRDPRFDRLFGPPGTRR